MDLQFVITMLSDSAGILVAIASVFWALSKLFNSLLGMLVASRKLKKEVRKWQKRRRHQRS
jgi:hypothetical protein